MMWRFYVFIVVIMNSQVDSNLQRSDIRAAPLQLTVWKWALHNPTIQIKMCRTQHIIFLISLYLKNRWFLASTLEIPSCLLFWFPLFNRFLFVFMVHVSGSCFCPTSVLHQHQLGLVMLATMSASASFCLYGPERTWSSLGLPTSWHMQGWF